MKDNFNIEKVILLFFYYDNTIRICYSLKFTILEIYCSFEYITSCSYFYYPLPNILLFGDLYFIS